MSGIELDQGPAFGEPVASADPGTAIGPEGCDLERVQAHAPTAAHYELFPHAADIGVRGVGATQAAAFEQAALALSSVVTDPAAIIPRQEVRISCAAPTAVLLLPEWLNRLIFEMAVRRMLFGRYSVAIDGTSLEASAWGEPVDRQRHAPAVEPKGATFTALAVEQAEDGSWRAQCVIDV